MRLDSKVFADDNHDGPAGSRYADFVDYPQWKIVLDFLLQYFCFPFLIEIIKLLAKSSFKNLVEGPYK